MQDGKGRAIMGPKLKTDVSVLKQHSGTLYCTVNGSIFGGAGEDDAITLR